MRRWEAETLPGLLGELAGGSRAALIFEDRAISATELADRAARLAGGLAASGVGAGDRVALWLPNRPEWLELHLALARLGALTVAINTRFRAHEVRDLLERSQARALAFAPGFKGIDFEGILGEAGGGAEPIRVGEPAYDALLEHEPAPTPRRPTPPAWPSPPRARPGRPKLVVHDPARDRRPRARRRRRLRLRRAGLRGAGDAAAVRRLRLRQRARRAGRRRAGGAPGGLRRRRGRAARRAPGVTHANGSDAMVLRLLEAAPDPPLREAGFAAFDGDPRAVVDAADAAGTTAYMCYGSTEVQALLAHAPQDGTPERRASPAARRSQPRRRCGSRRRRARDPRPERDGRLPRRRGARPHPRRVPPHGRPRPRHRRRVRLHRPPRRRAAPRRVPRRPARDRGLPREGDDVAEAAVVAVEHEGAQRPVAFAVARDGAVIDKAAALERCRASLAAFKVPRRVVELDELPPHDSPTAARCSARSCAGSRPKRCKKLHPRSEESAMSATPSTDRSTATHHGRRSADARPRMSRTTGSTSPRRPSSMGLHTSRRRFTLTGMAIRRAPCIVVMGLYGFAPDAMGEPAIGSDHVGAAAGTGLVFLTFVMAWAYARKANKWEGRPPRRSSTRARRRPSATREVRAMSVFAVTGEFNGLAVAIFAVVLAITLAITRWAATRTKTTTEFYTGGRGTSARKNGLAIAGDYLLVYVPGLRGPDVPVRLRRLDHRPRRLRRSSSCSTCWPSGCATPASSRSPTCSYRLKEKPARRGGVQHAAGDGHLSGRAAGRRRRAAAGAGRASTSRSPC